MERKARGQRAETESNWYDDNDECRLRPGMHAARKSQKHTPAHTRDPFSQSAWLHPCTHENTQTHVVTSWHTSPLRRHKQMCNGRCCPNIQLRFPLQMKKEIPVLCDVRVKLICKIKAELSQPCNHCSAWWVVSVSRWRSGRIWLRCCAGDSNRGMAFSVRGQVAAGNGRGKVERKEDSGWVWVVQLIMFPPSSSSWPWNQNRG